MCLDGIKVTPTVTGGLGGEGILERDGSIVGAGYLHRQNWIEYGEQVKSMTLSGSMDGEGIIPGHIMWLGIKDSN